MHPALTPARRKALYAVAAAAAGLAVIYRLIPSEVAPRWLNLVDALLSLLAPTVAIAHVTPDPTADDDIAHPEWAESITDPDEAADA